MDSSRKKLCRVWYCGHYDKDVSKSTFYSHRSLYCDRRTKKWSKTQLLIANESDECQILDCSSDSELSEEHDDVPGLNFEDPLYFSSESEQSTGWEKLILQYEVITILPFNMGSH